MTGSILRRADKISDATIARQALVTMPGPAKVQGRLDAVLPVGDRVTFVLVVGGKRAIFQVHASEIVEIHREAS